MIYALIISNFLLLSILIYAYIKYKELLLVIKKEAKNSHDLSNKNTVLYSIFSNYWGDFSDYEPSTENEKEGLEKMINFLKK